MKKPLHTLYTRKSYGFTAAFVVLALTVMSLTANAQSTYYWDPGFTSGTTGGGAGTWDTATSATNWYDTSSTSDIAWPNTGIDIASFGGTGGTVTVQDTGDANNYISVGGLVFTAGGYTLSGTTALNFGSNLGSINTSALGAASGETTISADLEGTGGITIDANGNTSSAGGGSEAQLIISGTNTGLTGGIAITGGLVNFQSAVAAGSVVTSMTSGTTVTTSTSSGDVITISGSGGLVASSSVALANNVVLSSGTATFRAYGTDTLTLNGVISGTAGFNKTDGGTVSLTNSANTFTGDVNVEDGTLALSNASTNTVSGTIAVSSSAILSLNGITNSSATAAYSVGTITVGAGGTLEAYSNSDGTITVGYNLGATPISITSGTLWFSQADDTTQNFNGAVAFSGSNTIKMTVSAYSGHTVDLNDAVTGSGTLTFTTSGGSEGTPTFTFTSGSNDYTGSVVLGSASYASHIVLTTALGAAAWTITNANWTVELSNTTYTFTDLNSSVGGTINGTGASSVLNVGSGNGTDSYSGVLTQTSGDTLSLVKTGTGSLTLSGSNTYTGTTTVNAGALLVNGNQSAATGAVTVASGATLGGTGTIGGATTVNGNIFAGVTIGATAGNVLNTGALTLASTATYQLDLDSTANTSDELISTGAISLNGTLAITDLDAGTPTGNLTIMQGTTLSGSFTGLAQGALVDNGLYMIDYTGDSVMLIAVPEPSTVALTIIFGAGMLLLFRRRFGSNR